MLLDHVIYGAGPDGLTATAERLGSAVGVPAVPGGVHTTFGTRNALVPLGRRQYLEVVAVDDPVVAAGHPFGRAVAQATGLGGGWLGWAVRVDDPAPVAQRLGREPLPGGRRRPDGVELAWRQVATEVLTTDPVLPFFLTWDVPDDFHPAAGGPSDVTVTSLTLRGDAAARARLAAWLGDVSGTGLGDVADTGLGGVRVDWSTTPAWTPITQVTVTSSDAAVILL